MRGKRDQYLLDKRGSENFSFEELLQRGFGSKLMKNWLCLGLSQGKFNFDLDDQKKKTKALEAQISAVTDWLMNQDDQVFYNLYQIWGNEIKGGDSGEEEIRTPQFTTRLDDTSYLVCALFKGKVGRQAIMEKVNDDWQKVDAWEIKWGNLVGERIDQRFMVEEHINNEGNRVTRIFKLETGVLEQTREQRQSSHEHFKVSVRDTGSGVNWKKVTPIWLDGQVWDVNKTQFLAVDGEGGWG